MGGIGLSVLLKHDGGGGALIYGQYFEDTKVLLDTFQFGSADLRLQGNNTVIVSDLVLYGQGISGRLTYDGVHTLGLASWWESITPVSDETRIANLERDIASATARHDREMASAVAAKMRYEQEIAATAAKYEGELASAQSDLAAAERRLSAAQADVRRLNARVSMGTSATATLSAAAGASIAPRSVDPSELDLSGAMLHL